MIECDSPDTLKLLTRRDVDCNFQIVEIQTVDFGARNLSYQPQWTMHVEYVCESFVARYTSFCYGLICRGYTHSQHVGTLMLFR